MRTRTLLLLAVGCGLLILLAGSIQLLRIAMQDDTELLGIGDTGTAGEASVTPLEYRPDSEEGFEAVQVDLSGLGGPEGLDGFSLRAPGERFVVADELTTCDGRSDVDETCWLSFATGELAAGGSISRVRRVVCPESAT